MSEQPELLELKKGMEFPDKEALDAHRDAYGKQENICIVTDRSDLVGGYITWRCKHGKQYRSAKGSDQHVKKITKNNDTNGDDGDDGDDAKTNNKERVTKTLRRGCPYVIKINRRKANKKTEKSEHWAITDMVDQHKYPSVSSLSMYANNRKPDEEEYTHVVGLLASRASNQIIIDNCKLKFGEQSNLLPKDVTNMRYRLSGVTNDPKSRSVFNFINQLEAANYDVRWAVNDQNELGCLFFTHSDCIKQARRFSDVVIMDATYKTNRHKLPLINIVGVDNVCRAKVDSLMTFAIAGAWICDEKTATYKWVLEQLESSVFPKDSIWRPKVFVTDQEHALVNSIDIVFPDSATILCYIHLMRNFDNNIRKLFTDNTYWENAKNQLYKIIRSQSMGGFNACLDEFNRIVDEHTSDEKECDDEESDREKVHTYMEG
jgi:hypothetical protein